MDNLIEKMAQLSPKDMELAIKLAKEERFRLLKEKANDDIKKLKDIYLKFKKGQTLNYNFNLPLTLNVTIQAEYEFGHPSDWKIDIRSKDASVLKFYELVKEYLNQSFIDDVYSLETLIPGAEKACAEESNNYKIFRNACLDFEEKYQIDPYVFLENL